jgi:hypothetical protein
MARSATKGSAVASTHEYERKKALRQRDRNMRIARNWQSLYRQYPDQTAINQMRSRIRLARDFNRQALALKRLEA